MKNSYSGLFRNRRVLVTGHTGFKGSWLSIWLKELGAEVIGFSLDLPTEPSNFSLSRMKSRLTDLRGDIRHFDAIERVVREYKPEIVFHLAAQTIVSRAVTDPVETIETNLLGTVHVLEAIRTVNDGSVRALVSVTSDKCYKNQEWVWAYRENDPLGGMDPYSASKTMAENAVASYEKSYFPPEAYERHGVSIASVRSGNVIGGGDFGDHRIVPDCMKALMAEKPIPVRNPSSIRPWQYILDPLSGYLCLAARLFEGGAALSGPWNFGPLERKGITVQQLVGQILKIWGKGSWAQASSAATFSEPVLVQVSWEKAANILDWQPVYTCEEGLVETLSWFTEYQKRSQGGGKIDMHDVCIDQIHRYTDYARRCKLDWTG